MILLMGNNPGGKDLSTSHIIPYPICSDVPGRLSCTGATSRQSDDCGWYHWQKLFYDPLLSLDSTISCARAITSLSFTDGKALSQGLMG